MIIVAFLIAMTLGFEFAKDMAEEAVPREMRPVLGQIFSEFTVLGFMAMVTYFMIQANVFAAASSLVYHDPEHLVHLFEKVHFDLFFVMMAFAAIAVWLLSPPSPPAGWLSFERFAVLHSKHVPGAGGAAAALRARVVHKGTAWARSLRSCTTASGSSGFDSGGEHRYNEHSWSKLANAAARGRGGHVAAPAPVPEEASPPAAAAKTSALDGLPASQALLARASERQAEALAQASGPPHRQDLRQRVGHSLRRLHRHARGVPGARRRRAGAAARVAPPREPADHHAAASARRPEGDRGAAGNETPAHPTARPPRAHSGSSSVALFTPAHPLSLRSRPRSRPCRPLHTPVAPSPTPRPVSTGDRHDSIASSRVSVDTPQDEWKVASTTMAAARQYVAAAEVMHQ